MDYLQIITLKNFKLLPWLKGKIEYGPRQKKLLVELVAWLQSSGKKSANNIDEIREVHEYLSANPFKNVMSTEMFTAIWDWKFSPKSATQSRIIAAIEAAKNIVPHKCKSRLYRGISNVQLDSIVKKLKNGKTKFKLSTVQNFSESYLVAKDFAESKNAFLTLLPGAEGGINLDELLFYYNVAWAIFRKDDYQTLDGELADDTVAEQEWAFTPDVTFEYIGKGKDLSSMKMPGLVFRIK